MSKSTLYTLEKIINGLQELKIDDRESLEYWIEELRNYMKSYGESVDIISRAATILKDKNP